MKRRATTTDPFYSSVKRSSERFNIPEGIVSELFFLDHETKLRVAEYIKTNYNECLQSARALEAFNAVMSEPCAR